MELKSLDMRTVDWEKLPVYRMKYCCRTCRFGKPDDLSSICLRDGNHHSQGYVCERWRVKEELGTPKRSELR